MVFPFPLNRLWAIVSWSQGTAKKLKAGVAEKWGLILSPYRIPTHTAGCQAFESPADANRPVNQPSPTSRLILIWGNQHSECGRKPSSQQEPGSGSTNSSAHCYTKLHEMLDLFEIDRIHMLAIKMVSHWGNMALFLQPWVKVSVKATLSGFLCCSISWLWAGNFLCTLGFPPSQRTTMHLKMARHIMLGRWWWSCSFVHVLPTLDTPAAIQYIT